MPAAHKGRQHHGGTLHQEPRFEHAMSTQNSSAVTPASSGLGRIVFERRGTTGEYALAGTLIVLSLVGVIAIAASSRLDARDKILLSLFAIAWTMLGVALVYNTKVKHFCCHERGVYNRTML